MAGDASTEDFRVDQNTILSKSRAAKCVTHAALACFIEEPRACLPRQNLRGWGVTVYPEVYAESG